MKIEQSGVHGEEEDKSAGILISATDESEADSPIKMTPQEDKGDGCVCREPGRERCD